MLDRLDMLSTDERDADERAYYEQKRDAIKQMLSELREEYKRLQAKVTRAGVPEQTIRNLAEMGDEYRELLEGDDLDFGLMRGLIDDLDIRGIVGVEQESGRKYADFLYFGKAKRKYLDDEDDSGRRKHRNQTPTQTTDNNSISLGSVLSSQNLVILLRRYLE